MRRGIIPFRNHSRLLATAFLFGRTIKSPNYSARYYDKDREQECTIDEDEIIKITDHKEYPHFEFRNYEHYHFDPYSLHLRHKIEYTGTVSVPYNLPIWEMGSKSLSLFVLFVIALGIPWMTWDFNLYNYERNVKERNTCSSIQRKRIFHLKT